MRVVSFVTQKGGSGKSTTAAARRHRQRRQPPPPRARPLGRQGRLAVDAISRRAPSPWAALIRQKTLGPPAPLVSIQAQLVARGGFLWTHLGKSG